MIHVKCDLTFAATGTTKSVKVHQNGFMRLAKLVIPNHTSPATATITIVDNNSKTVYDSTALAKNQTHTLASLEVPIDYDYTVTCTLSEAAGAGGSAITFSMYIEET